MATSIARSPYRAENVAKYLIYLASQEVVSDEKKEREGITNLKLQKILYFAQAYFLAKLGKPLFRENIEAWNYGPVVREVYVKFKHYSNKPIISDRDESSITEDDKEVLRNIWGTFGGYSASRLVSIVHAHTPWQEANASTGKVISHKSIKDYYGPLLNK